MIKNIIDISTLNDLRKLTDPEQVFVIDKWNNYFSIRGDMEYWEDGSDKYPDDPYRVEIFPINWIHSISELNSKKLEELLMDDRKSREGGIYFYHEESDCTRKAGKDAFESLALYFNYPSIFVLGKSEAENFLKHISNGLYIICITE